MKRAKDFLSKFKDLAPPNDAVQKAVAEAVNRIAGVPISRSDVSLTRGIAFVSCSSVAKSAIRAHLIDILTELYQSLPKARELVRDIR
jgi:hypothetical protein